MRTILCITGACLVVLAYFVWDIVRFAEKNEQESAAKEADGKMRRDAAVKLAAELNVKLKTDPPKTITAVEKMLGPRDWCGYRRGTGKVAVWHVEPTSVPFSTNPAAAVKVEVAARLDSLADCDPAAKIQNVAARPPY